MPIELSWYRPSRIIHVHIVGEPDVDEIQDFGRALDNMMHEGIAPIHILLEDSEGGSPPVNQLPQLKSVMELVEQDSFGWVVAVGETNASANFLGSMILGVLKIDFRRFDTREEAIAFLEQQDTTL